ncbi:hypothetical protein Cni_G18300 [Canna indica]|uniref:Uncharacterized protein n=1 Tax=Canna indica TaxID=4628 RepID=A0AAQ3KKE0_9LILI|nr:hypothetical protein Cni_G18300 [Canna indica]
MGKRRKSRNANCEAHEGDKLAVMDAVAPKTEVAQELARASLMTISQTTPGEDITAKTGAEMASVKESGDAEKYRSKLISLSYTEPPPPPST